MSRYSIEIGRPAQKELDRLDNAVFARIDPKILALANDPRPPGCKKLKNYKDQWRIRIGDYRVVYIIDNAKSSSPSHALRTAAKFMNSFS